MEAAEKTAHWTVEHRSTLVLVAVVVAVVLAAALGGWYYLSSQDEKASLDLKTRLRVIYGVGGWESVSNSLFCRKTI